MPVLEFALLVLAAVWPGGAALADEGESVTSTTPARPDLLAVAEGHVRLAGQNRGKTMLWGRIGGSEAERASARLLAEQLKPWVDSTALESFQFSTHRPFKWEVIIDGRKGAAVLASAVPAPFDARFPSKTERLPIKLVEEDSDWEKVSGKWAYVKATMDLSPGSSSVRKELLYQRAVEAGAAGFIFSLPTPPGAWRAVVPVDKPYAKPDERYPGGIRPIPAFCIDAEDGALLERRIAGGTLSASIEYETDAPLDGLNVVGYLKGQGTMRVALVTHLDSFFWGACDNASGMAAQVGLAYALAALPIERRPADFVFLGLSGHHDAAAGMHAFLDEDPGRADGLDQMILLEHVDAQHGREGGEAGWPPRLNDFRAAYLGEGGWPELRAALPFLVRETGIMQRTPTMIDGCIADLFAVCGRLKTFTLIQGPPYYHTDHDTMDKISREGLDTAVDFHLRLLEVSGALAQGAID